MRTYKFRVVTETGPRIVTTQTAAGTRAGVMRALGRAVARQCGTDVFEVTAGGCLMWREGVTKDYDLCDWRRASGITKAEERMVWKAAHGELMGKAA